MELKIIPKYVDTIIIDNHAKKNVKLIQSAGYQFDEYGECELTMEFYDGVAYDINGTGLMLRYPSMEELTKRKLDCVRSYVGNYTDALSQYDVAVKYGVLELSNKESDKVIHTTPHEQGLRDETLILMSADIYEKVYNMSDDYMDYNRTARIVRTFADQFEKELNWQGDENETRDYIQELEAFEEKALKELKVKFD